jgi:ferric-dicitrate binding protein FerR (iron transport regulator)
MDFQQITKYLQGESSEEEVAAVFQWIDADPENRKEFIAFKKVWALAAQGDENEAHLWRITSPRFHGKQTNLFLRIASYAAVFLLLIGTGVALQFTGLGVRQDKIVYQKSATISAPLGQMTNVELPDGSTVMLNSGSSITYNGNFSLGQRLVTLQGEAYFDVAADQKHPFIVQTSRLNFKVHGTSFNIEAYPEANSMSTTLVQGSLGVMDKSDKEILLLAPGENAFFDAYTSKMTVNKVNTDLYTSWKVGLITFRNEKLKDIARKIERWYNVEIVINNQKLGEQAYFGTIMKNKPVDQILEVLKLTSSLRYKIVTRSDKPTLIYWN